MCNFSYVKKKCKLKAQWNSIFHPSNSQIKKLDNILRWWGGGETGIAYIAEGREKWYNLYGGGFQTIWLYVTNLKTIPTVNLSWTAISNNMKRCMQKVIHRIFDIVKHRRLKKLWHRHTMENYAAVKRNQVLCTDMEWFLGDIIY